VVSLRELDAALHPIYVVPRDDVASELLIPAMSTAGDVRCMAGFFCSSSFAQLAPGLAAFLNRYKGQLRLLVSPRIEDRDRKAIELANADPAKVLADAARQLFEDGAVAASALARHTVECLAYLLASGRLELRVVLMWRGMFHPKVWIFSDTDSMLVAHGSSNPTEPGLLYNFETVSVERSWVETAKASAFATLFTGVWEGTDPTVLTIRMPEGLRLVKPGRGGSADCPTVDDFWAAWYEDAQRGLAPPLPISVRTPPWSVPRTLLQIPPEVKWEEGPFAHQGKAVRAWEGKRRRGILAIATGGGKTIASLVAATRLQDEAAPVLVIIAAPFRPLIEQWEQEVLRFGVLPLPLAGMSQEERVARLHQAVHSLELRWSSVEVAVITHVLLNQDGFREFLAAIPDGLATLLIADEVHNLGAPGFAQNPPETFQYRLGLSATPMRQYDEEGTEAILDYFGDVVFEFDLGAAIRAGCLTRYNYSLHPVELDDSEFEEWDELTQRLAWMGYGAVEDATAGGLSEEAKLLLFRRRSILENAKAKLGTLRSLLLAQRPAGVRHTLIYTSAKHRSGQTTQIVQVNRLLNELGIVAHELTYNETGSGDAAEILQGFSDGLYRAITCMKVLDEGVDIPQTTTAYLMASSTVRREWVQRRGRILRKAPGKSIAHLHDFLVIPPDVRSAAGRAILRGELERGREFASLAENSGAPGGPWEVMSRYGPMVT
jgi:superfamily II DNA or RNA helicase